MKCDLHKYVKSYIMYLGDYSYASIICKTDSRGCEWAN